MKRYLVIAGGRMTKKLIFLSLAAILITTSLVIYFNKTEVSATGTALTDEGQCLMETSQKLLEAHFKQAPLPAALYFIPDSASTASNRSLGVSVLAENNILTVSSFEALQQRTSHMLPKVIYLHPDAVNRVDDAWLREQYKAGIAIVALNTLVSELGTKLGLEASIADFPDLRAELAQKYPHFVLFHKPSVPGGASGETITADFLQNLDDIPFMINRSIDTYDFTPEYLNALTNTCLK